MDVYQVLSNIRAPVDDRPAVQQGHVPHPPTYHQLDLGEIGGDEERDVEIRHGRMGRGGYDGQGNFGRET